jgi:uncharacterized protein
VGKQAGLLRIYSDEGAYVGDRKISEYIASLAREHNLAGVTVMEALVGFGHSAHVHRRQMFESDRAVVVELVDEEAKLRSFAAGLADVPDIGLMTFATVEIVGGKGS